MKLKETVSRLVVSLTADEYEKAGRVGLRGHACAAAPGLRISRGGQAQGCQCKRGCPQHSTEQDSQDEVSIGLLCLRRCVGVCVAKFQRGIAE